jgi:hypothetical protein
MELFGLDILSSLGKLVLVTGAEKFITCPQPSCERKEAEGLKIRNFRQPKGQKKGQNPPKSTLATETPHPKSHGPYHSP